MGKPLSQKDYKKKIDLMNLPPRDFSYIPPKPDNSQDKLWFRIIISSVLMLPLVIRVLIDLPMPELSTLMDWIYIVMFITGLIVLMYKGGRR